MCARSLLSLGTPAETALEMPSVKGFHVCNTDGSHEVLNARVKQWAGRGCRREGGGVWGSLNDFMCWRLI